MNIYYLGPEGSYSHLLVQNVFYIDQKMIPCDSFDAVVAAVQLDQNSIGALAIENSISSSVHQTVDLLYTTPVSIVGEASMNVQMNLIGCIGATKQSVKEVYSHPQAIAQCSEYLKKHGYIVHELSSTSAAVAYVLAQQDSSIAAIGMTHSKDLQVIHEDIANVKNNMTRWVFIAHQGAKAISSIHNKITYIFKTKHEAGSLLKVLSGIAALQGNMTKIESRPLPGTNWEYGFWVDIEIEENLKGQFDTMMKEVTLECRCLGAYERGRLFD